MVSDRLLRLAQQFGMGATRMQELCDAWDRMARTLRDVQFHRRRPVRAFKPPPVALWSSPQARRIVPGYIGRRASLQRVIRKMPHVPRGARDG